MAQSRIHPALHEQENFLPNRELIWVIVTLGTIVFVINIDHNGLSTLLPTIAQDLHAEKSITWAGSSALVATTVFSLLYGRFSDIFGRKALLVSAVLVYSLAELGCGFALNPPMLYALRAVTGASGGGVGNLATIIASDVVSLRQRGQYMAIIAPFMLLGNILGPLVAAGVLQTPIGWRGLFWLLSPLAALSALLAIHRLPSTTPTDSLAKNVAKIDWIGSLLSTITIVTFMIPVSGAGTYYTWDSPLVICLLCISSISFFAFLFVEWKLATLPIIPLTLFARPDVCALLVQTFTLGWINQTSVYFIPLYAQILRDWSATISGLLLLPIIAVQVVVSMLAGRWMSRSGQYGATIRLGSACLLVGTILQAFFGRSTRPQSAVVASSLIGLGVGAANQPMVVAMQAHTKKSERAVVTSTRNFFRFLGSAFGVGVSAAILQSTLRASLPAEFKYLADSPYSVQGLDQAARLAILPAYENALRYVFIGSAGASILCSLGLLGWRDEGYESRPEDDSKLAQEADRTRPDEERRLLADDRLAQPSYGTSEIDDSEDGTSSQTTGG